MTQFMIELPHTEQSCPVMLSDMSGNEPDLFNKICWGCMGDSHVSWGMVDAESADQVRESLPQQLREQAIVIEVDKLSPEDVQRMRDAAP